MTARRQVAARSAATLLALAALVGCSHAATTPAPSANAPLPAPSGPTVDVEMQDYAFAGPAVEIPIGTSIRWTNRGQAPHTATAVDGRFDTGQLATGASATQVFTSVGSYAYACSLHPDMRGVITVTDGEPAPSDAASAEPSMPASSAASSGDPDGVPGPARFEIEVVLGNGRAVPVTVVDHSGLVREAAAGAPGDGASVPGATLVAANDDEATIRLTWMDGPCAEPATLMIDEGGRAMTVVQPPCTGDAIGFDRVVLLHLAAPLDAAAIDTSFQAAVDTSG